MIKRFIKIFILLLITGCLVYRYFFYIDFKADCFISIKPSFLELSTVNIKKAIKVLKRAAPDEYQKLCENVNKINPNFACGGFGGGCYYPNDKDGKREIDISTARDGFLGITAGIIAHETCHAIQHKENRSFSEQECYEVDDAVLKKVVEF